MLTPFLAYVKIVKVDQLAVGKLLHYTKQKGADEDLSMEIVADERW